MRPRLNKVDLQYLQIDEVDEGISRIQRNQVGSENRSGRIQLREEIYAKKKHLANSDHT